MVHLSGDGRHRGVGRLHEAAQQLAHRRRRRARATRARIGSSRRTGLQLHSDAARGGRAGQVRGGAAAASSAVQMSVQIAGRAAAAAVGRPGPSRGSVAVDVGTAAAAVQLTVRAAQAVCSR